MSPPRIFLVSTDDIDAGPLVQSAEILIAGGVVAFPTETVYGIGCLKSDEDAIARIYAIKGRDTGKPLAVYLPDSRSIRRVAGDVPPAAEKLIAGFLPGPLTLVLLSREGVPTGYRVSPNPVLKMLLEHLPEPVVGTSANRSGEKDPTTADEVTISLGDDIDAIIDSGPCPGSIPSTVVDCTGAAPRILREGRIPSEEIEQALK